MVTGIEDLGRDLLFDGDDLRYQREFLVAREPVYARLLALLHDALSGDLGTRLAEAWAGREFHSRYERPLLLLAALRYDALRDGGAHPLHAALALSPADAAVATASALAAAHSPGRTRFWRAVRERAVQTNETTRAVTWLWPLALLASAGECREVTLVDIGASAGLNLIADALPALWSDAAGVPIAIAPRPQLVSRIGFDIAPLDVRDEDAAHWLRACVWPSDTARLSRLEQAIACFRASSTRADAPQLVTRALPEVPARLEALPGEPFILCMQSIVRDYLSVEARERYERGMREFLLRRPPCAALWTELEVDSANAAVPANSVAISARFVAADGVLRELVLARTSAHPQQLFVDPAAVATLQREFGRSDWRPNGPGPS